MFRAKQSVFVIEEASGRVVAQGEIPTTPEGRRSHKTRMTWERTARLAKRWPAAARICHSYPLRRLGVVT